MCSFKLSGLDLTSITRSLDRQTVCRGCRRIEILIDESRRQNAAVSGRLTFHHDYAELEKCAHSCDTCRIFRQALLLRCATIHEAEELCTATGGCNVLVRLQSSEPNTSQTLERLVIHLEIRDHPQRSAWVRGLPAMVEGLNLDADPNSPRVIRQIQKWLNDCDSNHHGTCSALRWSAENPTRLVHISTESELQLRGLDKDIVPYVALSYSWGTQIVTKEEGILMENGKTTYKNLDSRYNKFQATELPFTLHEAITLCRDLGISYVWIDSLCIIQDDNDRTDFEREAPNMHKYYGNALFTLAVCSNLKATDPLLTTRSAFSHRINPSRLGDFWISTPDISTNEMRLRSPLSSRAWTLQEESLSPRILYWTPNRLYWSCAESQHVESAHVEGKPTASPSNSDTALVRSAQEFLLACNRGSSEARHRAWLTLIESYTRRGMSNPMDRFPALSALASKYNSSYIDSQAYIAGMWSASFYQDISWVVTRSAPTNPSFEPNEPPSWTWASLPLGTGIQMCGYNCDARLQLLEIGMPDAADKRFSSTDAVQRGAFVRYVRVCARFRRFWEDSAIFQTWPTISATSHDKISVGTPAKETFLFADMLEQSVFSANVSNGKIVSYESRKLEIVGQLDYVVYAASVCDSNLRVLGMEITDTTMLLVEELYDGMFRRVGIVTGFRPDFFDGTSQLEAIFA